MKANKFTYLLLMLLLFIPGAMSANFPKILLINSDASLEKYRIAQAEFENSINYPVKEINLADNKWKIDEIEDLLYDEYADLIYCIGSKAYLVVNKFVRETDVVFSSIINWYRMPEAKKTFGVSNELHSEMQLMLFRYIFPETKKIGVLYSDEYNMQWFGKVKDRAKDIGVEIIGRQVSESGRVVSSLKEMLNDIDVLWLISDPVVLSDKKILNDVFKSCDTKKIPVFSYHDAFSTWGASLIVSVDNPTVGRQAAGIANNLISGTQMKKRVQYPAGSHIILNLKKIKEYGIQHEENSLSAVNQIIE